MTENDENSYQPPQRFRAGHGRRGPLASAKNVPLAMVWALITATAGGFACGLVIDRYGELGSITLWAMGAVAGYVGQRILTGRSRLVGFVLIASCVSALVIAEVCWIHWNTEQGAESWLTAFTLLPTFVQEYERAALIGAMFTGFGAWSAYRQTAARYRRVAIDDTE